MNIHPIKPITEEQMVELRKRINEISKLPDSNEEILLDLSKRMSDDKENMELYLTHIMSIQRLNMGTKHKYNEISEILNELAYGIPIIRTDTHTTHNILDTLVSSVSTSVLKRIIYVFLGALGLMMTLMLLRNMDKESFDIISDTFFKPVSQVLLDTSGGD